MRGIYVFFISVFFVGNTYSQSFIVSGYIRDSSDKEALIGATIKADSLGKRGAVTNTIGFFSVSLEPGNYNFEISFIGYKTVYKRVTVHQNVELNINLASESIHTQEVIVSTEARDRNVRSTEMSRAELSADKIKTLPVILGEPDVLKAITLLPGIKSGGEGNTGFYVRGGGPDQNLIMMDDAVVYNPSHLLGFMSVFNTDAVRNAEIIKGGMPANYGGRLSSILNVNMREGDNKKFRINGGIGLIASRLTFEGPIQKGKSSFIISGRRTYIDALAQPFLKKDQKGNNYHFYDFNFKASYNLTSKDRIFVSGYLGRDVFKLISPSNRDIVFKINWGNSIATLRWNHIFSPKLFVNTSLVYSRYDLKSAIQFINSEFGARSGIRDWNLKSDVEFLPNSRNKVKLGFNYTWHTFIPGIATGKFGSTNFEQEIKRQYAHEAAFYCMNDFSLTDRIFFNIGLR